MMTSRSIHKTADLGDSHKTAFVVSSTQLQDNDQETGSSDIVRSSLQRMRVGQLKNLFNKALLHH